MVFIVTEIANASNTLSIEEGPGRYTTGIPYSQIRSKAGTPLEENNKSHVDPQSTIPKQCTGQNTKTTAMIRTGTDTKPITSPKVEEYETIKLITIP